MIGSLVLLPIVGTSVVEASWFLIAPVQTVMNRGLRNAGPEALGSDAKVDR
jgi:hypothetical protein